MANKRHTSKRLIASGVGVGVLLGGASGLALTLPTGAFAQDDTPTAEAPAEPQRGGPMAGVLDEFVANRTITQEQADAIAGAAEARRGERSEGRMSEGRMSEGRMGEGRMSEGRGQRGHGGPGASLGAAAEAIGISVEDLRTQLRDGQSLAAIAEANGVSTETLVDALTSDARERITEMVQRVPGQKPGS